MVTNAYLANEALRALGDPMRQEIVKMLGSGPKAVTEIAGKLPISRPGVSKHLKILCDAKLIEHESVGTRNFYRLRSDGAEAVREYLDNVWDSALHRFKFVAENLPRKRKTND